MAAVSVVLPWSMCPMVPTLTCGLVLVKVSLAMLYSRRLHLKLWASCTGVPGKPSPTLRAPQKSAGRAADAIMIPNDLPSPGRENPELPLGFEPRTSSLPRTRSTN